MWGDFVQCLAAEWLALEPLQELLLPRGSFQALCIGLGATLGDLVDRLLRSGCAPALTQCRRQCRLIDLANRMVVVARTL